MARQRRDADRRSRQCARFARLIRIARLLMGNGRWGPEDLAREIECSTRTIFRDVEVLIVSGMPITYDKNVKAYRVREGFRFGGLEPQKVDSFDPANPAVHDLLVHAQRILKEAEGFLDSLRHLCDQLETARRAK